MLKLLSRWLAWLGSFCNFPTNRIYLATSWIPLPDLVDHYNEEGDEDSVEICLLCYVQFFRLVLEAREIRMIARNARRLFMRLSALIYILTPPIDHLTDLKAGANHVFIGAMDAASGQPTCIAILTQTMWPSEAV